MPGVEKLLRALEAAKIRRCVVTHSALAQTALIRSKIPVLQTLPQWITREDYEKPKPNPECYLKAIQLYGKMGDRIVGFEDSVRGSQGPSRDPRLAGAHLSSTPPAARHGAARGGGLILHRSKRFVHYFHEEKPLRGGGRARSPPVAGGKDLPDFVRLDFPSGYVEERPYNISHHFVEKSISLKFES